MPLPGPVLEKLETLRTRQQALHVTASRRTELLETIQVSERGLDDVRIALEAALDNIDCPTEHIDALRLRGGQIRGALGKARQQLPDQSQVDTLLDEVQTLKAELLTELTATPGGTP